MPRLSVIKAIEILIKKNCSKYFYNYLITTPDSREMILLAKILTKHVRISDKMIRKPRLNISFF